MEKKTNEIVNAYALLKDAKSSKMEDADRFKVVKALRQIKKIAEDFEDFRNDAMEQLKGEKHDEMLEKAKQWQNEGQNTSLTEKERIAINEYFDEYNKKVTDCLKDELEKTHTLDYETLSDDAFSKLIATNDWTLGQIEQISTILC